MDQVHYLGAFMTGLFRINGLKTTQLGKILVFSCVKRMVRPIKKFKKRL
jgi:hypothetical protein